MNLNEILPAERTIDITHPGNGSPVGLQMTIVSIEDDRLKTVKRNINDESLKLQARNKAFKADDLERNGEMLLFTATLGWKWYNPTGKEGDAGFDPEAEGNVDGQQPEFNKREFYALIRRFPWIATQLREAVDEEKAFFTK